MCAIWNHGDLPASCVAITVATPQWPLRPTRIGCPGWASSQNPAGAKPWESGRPAWVLLSLSVLTSSAICRGLRHPLAEEPVWYTQLHRCMARSCRSCAYRGQATRWKGIRTCGCCEPTWKRFCRGTGLRILCQPIPQVHHPPDRCGMHAGKRPVTAYCLSCSCTSACKRGEVCPILSVAEDTLPSKVACSWQAMHARLQGHPGRCPGSYQVCQARPRSCMAAQHRLASFSAESFNSTREVATHSARLQASWTVCILSCSKHCASGNMDGVCASWACITLSGSYATWQSVYETSLPFTLCWRRGSCCWAHSWSFGCRMRTARCRAAGSALRPTRRRRPATAGRTSTTAGTGSSAGPRPAWGDPIASMSVASSAVRQLAHFGHLLEIARLSAVCMLGVESVSGGHRLAPCKALDLVV